MADQGDVRPTPMWVVSVTLAGPAGDDPERIAEVIRSTRGLNASGVFAMRELVYLQVPIRERTAAAAIVAVDDLLLDVVGDEWAPAAIIVESQTDHHGGGSSYIPPLAGLAEVAQILGLTEMQAVNVSLEEDFPAPIAELGGGPIWSCADVEVFARIASNRRSRHALWTSVR